MSKENKLDSLFEKLKQNEIELKQEIEKLIEQKKQAFEYRLEQSKVIFDQSIKKIHKKNKTKIIPYLLNSKLSTFLMAPIIYSMFFPLFILDLTITIYQHICFRVFKIPRVKRSDYVVIDRQYLSYLNVIEKFNCIYCGYGNGVVAYALEVVARTEQYWCPIKHTKKHLKQHARSENFVDYGDVDAYKKQLEQLRKQWPEK
jgi:hypothetical protein